MSNILLKLALSIIVISYSILAMEQDISKLTDPIHKDMSTSNNVNNPETLFYQTLRALIKHLTPLSACRNLPANTQTIMTLISETQINSNGNRLCYNCNLDQAFFRGILMRTEGFKALRSLAKLARKGYALTDATTFDAIQQKVLDLQCLQILIRLGASVNITNCYKQNPLSLAVDAHDNALVKMLLEANADDFKQGLFDTNEMSALQRWIMRLQLDTAEEATNLELAQLLAQSHHTNISKNSNAFSLAGVLEMLVGHYLAIKQENPNESYYGPLIALLKSILGKIDK